MLVKFGRFRFNKKGRGWIINPTSALTSQPVTYANFCRISEGIVIIPNSLITQLPESVHLFYLKRAQLPSLSV